jgi:hypothetical protein
MPLILAALTLFAVLLMMAHLRRPLAIAVWIGVLTVCLYVFPGPSKIVAPLAAILSLGLTEALSNLRPH